MKIFVSYTSRDRPVAEKLAMALVADGHDVFFDRRRLRAGRDFHRALREAVVSSDLFVFLVSPESVRTRGYARSELKFARERWPNPLGAVLAVAVRPTPAAELPAYLSPLTVLEPEGDLCAEVTHAVAAWHSAPEANALWPRRRELLVHAAVREAIGASYGGGPLGVVHRRLAQAERWLHEALSSATPPASDPLRALVSQAMGLVQQARSALPPAGSTDEFRPSEDLSHARWLLDRAATPLAEALGDAAMSPQRWPVLGFADEAAYQDTILPTADAALAAPDAMTLALARHLLANPEFVPSRLVAHGFPRAVVQDLLNALLGSKWAHWTLQAPQGDDWSGTLTPVGRELLARSLARLGP